jgi:hypothetical protein
MFQFKESKAQAETRKMSRITPLGVRFRWIVYNTTACPESGIYNSVFGPQTGFWFNSGLEFDRQLKWKNTTFSAAER